MAVGERDRRAVADRGGRRRAGGQLQRAGDRAGAAGDLDRRRHVAAVDEQAGAPERARRGAAVEALSDLAQPPCGTLARRLAVSVSAPSRASRGRESSKTKVSRPRGAPSSTSAALGGSAAKPLTLQPRTNRLSVSLVATRCGRSVKPVTRAAGASKRSLWTPERPALESVPSPPVRTNSSLPEAAGVAAVAPAGASAATPARPAVTASAIRRVRPRGIWWSCRQHPPDPIPEPRPAGRGSERATSRRGLARSSGREAGAAGRRSPARSSGRAQRRTTPLTCVCKVRPSAVRTLALRTTRRPLSRGRAAASRGG